MAVLEFLVLELKVGAGVSAPPRSLSLDPDWVSVNKKIKIKAYGFSEINVDDLPEHTEILKICLTNMPRFVRFPRLSLIFSTLC